jgi:hypothetical protein
VDKNLIIIGSADWYILVAVDETVKFKSTVGCPIVGLTMSTKISTDESNPGSSSVTVNMPFLSANSTTIIVQVV